MIAMIAGCVQAPTEAEKLADTEVVKKIDESKDWVYFDQPLIYDFELSDNCGKAESYLYEHELLNVKMPVINIDLESIKRLNQAISNQLNDVYQKVSYYDASMIPVTNVSSQTFYNVGHNILSVEIRTLLIYGEEEIQINVYNIDLTTGEILNNDDLLSRFDSNFTEAEELVRQRLVDKKIPVCEINEEYGQIIKKPCYFDDAIRIDENSLLILNNQNQLVCIMYESFYEDSKQGYPYAERETEILIKSYK